MACPVWDLAEFDLGHWDLEDLCELMGCLSCTAEPGEMPWIPDGGGRVQVTPSLEDGISG